MPKDDSLPDAKQVNFGYHFPGVAKCTNSSASLFLRCCQEDSAFAADLGVKAPSATLTTQAVNWTGFYLGGNAGGVIARGSGTSNFTDTTSTATSNPQSNLLSTGVFLGGVQAGFNWQFSPIWIAGLEADWDWTSAKDSFCRQTDPTSTACSDNGDGFETISSKTEWLATFAVVGV